MSLLMRSLTLGLLLLTGCLSNSKKKDTAAPPVVPSDPGIPTPTNSTVTLQVALPPASEHAQVRSSIVEFVILPNTGNRSWNEKNQRLVLFQGQTLRIRNQDSIPHRLQTLDRPCVLDEIKPGATGDCVLTQTYDSRTDGPLHSIQAPEALFWLTVLPDPLKIMESQCLSCHSSARALGGLDLTSTPPTSKSSPLLPALKERLAAENPAERRMPPSRPALLPFESESLIVWAEAGYPRMQVNPNSDKSQHELRWRLLLDGVIQNEGMLAPGNSSIKVAKDSRLYNLQIEEKQGQSWKLILDFLVRPDRDQSLNAEENRLRRTMSDGYYSIEDFHRFALENQVTSVADFLSRLPREFRLNYVLMKESGSRHLASVKYPRGITFSQGARIFIAFSSHPDDPLRENLEIAEAMEDGTWKFREFSFTNNKPELSRDDSACQSCHTAKPRPIWGSYPSWPGALGDTGGKVTADEFAVLKGLPTDPITKDRFGFLIFKLRDDLHSFYLPERSYAYPNTVLNFELGRRASYNLYRRLKQHAQHRLIFAEMLHQDECPSVSTLALQERGIITAADLRLDLTAKEILRDTFRSWNEGNNGLTQLLNYWGLVDLMSSDPILADIFAPIQPHMIPYTQIVDSSGMELSLESGNYAGFRPSQYAYPIVLGDRLGFPVENPIGTSVSTRRQEFCSHLQKIIANP